MDGTKEIPAYMENRIKRSVSLNNINADLKIMLLNVLDTDDIEYNDTIETVDLWDSMMHMEIMVAIENKYSLRITPEEIVVLTSVKAIQNFLELRGVL